MSRRILGILGGMALVLAGCTSGRAGGDLGIGPDIPQGDVPPSACTGCHGTEAPWNPPPDTRGHDDPAFRGVGAHAAHLAGGLGAPVSCDTCHVVPARVDSAGHIDSKLPAEVSFSGRAVLDDLVPVASAADGDEKAVVTCRNAYCHGASLDGGTATEPGWNVLDAAKFGQCGACHGMSPATTRSGAPHPDAANCSSCHAEVVGADGTIIDPSKHVDGQVQATGGGECNSCHGSDDNSAPPKDPLGRSDTSLVTVGAHQSHLKATRGKTVACSTCHSVPTKVDDPGHINGTGDVAFKGLAVVGGATPAWNEGAATCAGTYCHGALLDGGTKTTPKWTVVDGTEAACGTCHGAPPPAPHPDVDDCSACHGEVVNADKTFKDPSKHVDGILQVSGTTCNACHGNTDNAAPPKDTGGSEDTTKVTVGAHQSHLKTPAGIFAQVPCSTCHKVPGTVGDAGHIDGQSTVAFTGRAVTDGATPAWDESAATCAGAYCHGATLSGGSLPTPKWTKVDGTQAVCGNCHGVPPLPPHPQEGECALCHGEVINADRTFKDPSRHVDGTLDVVTGSTCTTCHGNGDNAAPPKDLEGSSDTTKITVGAHQSHLKVPTGQFAPVACTSCHTVPTSTKDPTHIDGQVEVAFHGNALADGAAPVFNAGSATCSGAYCHGATLGGGTLTTPKWTQVDGAQVACGTCHAIPPPPPHPNTDLDCQVCHSQTSGPNRTIAHPENHVNGQVDVSDVTQCNVCHGSVDNPAPPKDLSGSQDTGRVTVGAHQAHLRAPAGLSLPVACSTCHLVPAGFNASGHVDTPSPAEVTFSGLAKAESTSPAWDRAAATCTNTYCHGTTLPGGTKTSPNWTVVNGSEAACGTCHGAPPPSPHPEQANCSLCHGATAGWDGSKATIAHPEKHIDGTVDLQMATACNACHGSAENNAPPVDTHGNSSTSQVTVGAHQSHLKATLGKAVACTECHVVPTKTDDPGHIDNPTATVTFGSLSKTDGATPSWDRTAQSCANSYCHGATFADGTNTTPKWTVVNGTQKACGTCHGNPPGLPHIQSPECGACHAPTATVDGTIADPSHHVDGVLDVRTTFACNSCHGSADNDAPPVDTAGQSATDRVSVGAHQAHLKGTSNLAVPLVCTDCHKVPAAMGDAGHIDTTLPAELTFGATSKLNGANPSWSHATAKCSGTYCHGSTMPTGGATNRTPTWNVVDNSQDACGTCHGVSPRTGKHPSVEGDHSGVRCVSCHGTTTTNTATPAISVKTRHINGTVEIQILGGTYDRTTKLCTPGCHSDSPETW